MFGYSCMGGPQFHEGTSSAEGGRSYISEAARHCEPACARKGVMGGRSNPQTMKCKVRSEMPVPMKCRIALGGATTEVIKHHAKAQSSQRKFIRIDS